MKVKEGSKKVGLKLNIQKTKIMASSSITSWVIVWEIVADFIFWAPKSLQMVIAAMKLKMLTPWKESYDQPRQHIEKQRHHFVNKGPSSQGYGFSSGHEFIQSHGCLKAEHCRIDPFELWCWRRLLRLGLQGDPTSPY